jgi:hypothetical protein
VEDRQRVARIIRHRSVDSSCSAIDDRHSPSRGSDGTESDNVAVGHELGWHCRVDGDAPAGRLFNSTDNAIQCIDCAARNISGRYCPR